MTTSSRVRGNDPGEASKRLRENIKRVRAERGMTQAALADELARVGRPIPLASIAKIEAGDRRVDVDDLVALAEALGAPFDQLLADPDQTLFDRMISRARTAHDDAVEALARVESVAVDLAFFAQERIESLTPFQRYVIEDWISLGPDRIVHAFKERSLGEAAIEQDYQARHGIEPKPEQLLTGHFWDVYERTWDFSDGEHSEAS